MAFEAALTSATLRTARSSVSTAGVSGISQAILKTIGSGGSLVSTATSLAVMFALAAFATFRTLLDSFAQASRSLSLRATAFLLTFRVAAESPTNLAPALGLVSARKTIPEAFDSFRAVFAMLAPRTFRAQYLPRLAQTFCPSTALAFALAFALARALALASAQPRMLSMTSALGALFGLFLIGL